MRRADTGRRLLLLLAITIATVALAARPANDMVAVGRRGAVVAAEAHAAGVGLEVLRKGGNAVDAAVATFLALAVTHPQAGNLGGGGFMLIRMADGRSMALDFREQAPAAAHRDMYLRKDGSVDSEASRLGVTAAGVPGSPAGVALALETFGTMELADLAAPAIALARDGFEVGHFLAASLHSAARKLGRFASSREVFFDGEETLGAGALLRQPDLATTLERFAEKGSDGFYKGETATLIAAQMTQDGGYITEKDLSAYTPAVREPLVGHYRGFDVVSMPPPSSGGVAVLQMLNILEPYDIASMGFGSSRSVHLLVEAMRRAYADRARWLGDADFYAVPVEGLISKEYAEVLRKSIRTDRVTEVEPGRPPGAKEGEDTTHFSVVDAAGNAVSCTTTINSSFGAGVVVQGAGFLLNNEMDDFSAKPGVPNQFGLVGGEANAIAPKKRMLSSMTPTIIVKDGELRYVLGSPGGGRIINTVLQVAIDLIDHHMTLPRAVAAPRVHHQWKPDHLFWEAPGMAADVRDALAEMGHTFAEHAVVVGRCQAIERRADGMLVGAADPRSSGSAVAW